jgi:anti-anti-sigma regulatory factor
MTNKGIYIKVAEYFNGQVNGRSSINSVFSKDKEQNVILDFQDITFISRSVADELLAHKETYSKENLSISFVNCCDEVKKMIDNVGESRKNSIKNTLIVNRLSFSDEIESDKYLLSI